MGEVSVISIFYIYIYMFCIRASKHLHIKTLTCAGNPSALALITATLGSYSHCQSIQFANLALKSYFQSLTTNSTSFELLCPCGDY